MHATDLGFNHALGITLAPDGEDGHLLEMPESPLLLNHVGSVHASAQFALAEEGSAEFLLHSLGDRWGQVLAVLRTSDVKFRKPAHGALNASARFAVGDADKVWDELTARERASVAVLVELTDAQGVVTMRGKYGWFLQQRANPM